jgi:eukaryotic-like serine/threonine-protein kinase
MRVDFQVPGFEVIGRLAVGGMAEVYQAKAIASDHSAERSDVALKRLHPSRRSDAAAVQQFVDEGKLAVQFVHPHIVRSWRCFKVADDYFIEQELVRGRDLAFMHHAFAKASAPFPMPAAIAIARAVLSALVVLHDTRMGPKSAPVVHRDIAPANILLSLSGEIKLTDFGVAEVEGLTVGERGALRGTPGYLSPESALGWPADHRSDLFGVGVVLHELLTGQRLFASASEIETLQRSVAARAREVRSLNKTAPVLLSRIVRKALQADPHQRFQSASAFVAALDTLTKRHQWATGKAALAPLLKS